MIYPNSLRVKVALTTRSAFSESSDTVENESIFTLNLNLSGSPQYESEANSIASINLLFCSTKFVNSIHSYVTVT